MVEQSDTQLLTAWAEGCTRSGNVLIERHVDSVHRFFRSKVSRDFVEDLVQQTFMAGLEAYARFRGEVPFKHYLLRIARFLLLGHYRAKSRACGVDVDITGVRDLGTTPSGRLTKARDEQRLAEAMQSLPIEHQIVLELAYWEGLAGADIAFVLGVSLNTAYSRLHRAKQALRHGLLDVSNRGEGAVDIERLDVWAQRMRETCRR